MAGGFNIKKFGDNLSDYSLKLANKAISDIEFNVLLAMRNCVQNINNYVTWTNRTYNLVSSCYAVLFYKGRILGVETAGADAESLGTVGNKSRKQKKEANKRVTKMNPIFSYWYTGRGYLEWRSDHHDPKWTGRVYANRAIDEAKDVVDNSGYSIVIGFAMPYANFPRGWLNVKTSGVIGVMIANLYTNEYVMKLNPTTKKLRGIGEDYR